MQRRLCYWRHVCVYVFRAIWSGWWHFVFHAVDLWPAVVNEPTCSPSAAPRATLEAPTAAAVAAARGSALSLQDGASPSHLQCRPAARATSRWTPTLLADRRAPLSTRLRPPKFTFITRQRHSRRRTSAAEQTRLEPHRAAAVRSCWWKGRRCRWRPSTLPVSSSTETVAPPRSETDMQWAWPAGAVRGPHKNEKKLANDIRLWLGLEIGLSLG